MILLPKEAKEESTYIIEVRFKDEDGNLVNPKTFNWWLLTLNGDVINNRENITVDSPSSITNIVLRGEDLLPGWEIIVVKATYDSRYGDDMVTKNSAKFYVDNLLEDGQ